MSTSAEARLRAGVVTETPEATRALAAAWAAQLPADVTLALHGDLGVGKTTFVQGLAQAWEIREAVTSPTFTVCNFHRGTRLLAHLDAYRLAGGAQFEELMLADFLTSPYCLAVEWPERILEHLPADTLHLELSLEAAGQHRLRLR
ncbi:MAG TPA: tRNA (adenosine(37)-N6)-threonylcarbamoyltransferase complex ATPase subunit type 1 TsaE [Opitutaceae bacterium]|jgi:tRNA threonylcarbamoyladenosine biosynthesis protein TsaE